MAPVTVEAMTKIEPVWPNITIWKRRGAAWRVLHMGPLKMSRSSQQDAGTAMRFCCTFDCEKYLGAK
jgi:hypothetical protein